MLEKDFYTKVEDKTFLKHILYGDSVANYTYTVIQKKNENSTTSLTFDEIWNYLIELGCETKIQNNKEYIYLTDEFKTISYNSKNDKLITTTPNYIMRHYVKDELIRLQLSDIKNVDVTKNHSMLEYNIDTSTLTPINPSDCRYLPILDSQHKFDATLNIRAIKVQNKQCIDFEGYVYDLCVPETQNFVANGILVHNTDSIFITIPDNQENLKNDSLETKWEKAENAANGINDLIVKYTKDYIMKRCNFSSDKNQTFFKTELLMDSMMFLDVKKQYAYKLCVKEGNVLETPEIEYTGIQVIKSDAAKLTQDLLRDIIENIVLNTKVQNKEQETVNTINKYIEKVKHDVGNYIFTDIAFPGKWAKSENIINGMKIYNHIIGEEIFSPMSAGKWIYCVFDKDKLNIPETKSNVVCVPNDYDSAKIKNVFESFNIKIDLKTQWSKLYTTTCQRVYDLIKKTQAKN